MTDNTTPQSPEPLPLRKPPTTMPSTTTALYEYLGHPEHYEGESLDDFTSRKNLFEDFQNKLTASGLHLNDLIQARMGIKPASGASPLVRSLIGRIL